MRGFAEAYQRLVWARDNPPPPERLEEIENERRVDEYRVRLKRLRRGIA